MQQARAQNVFPTDDSTQLLVRHSIWCVASPIRLVRQRVGPGVIQGPGTEGAPSFSIFALSIRMIAGTQCPGDLESFSWECSDCRVRRPLAEWRFSHPIQVTPKAAYLQWKTQVRMTVSPSTESAPCGPKDSGGTCDAIYLPWAIGTTSLVHICMFGALSILILLA